VTDEITIVIADDHPLVRQVCGRRSRKTSGCASSRSQQRQRAVEAVATHSPQVTILDIDMPVMNGFDAARTIRKKGLATEIIFLTMHRDEEMFNEAIDLGAKGFVLKDSALADIVECINAVAAATTLREPRADNVSD